MNDQARCVYGGLFHIRMFRKSECRCIFGTPAFAFSGGRYRDLGGLPREESNGNKDAPRRSGPWFRSGFGVEQLQAPAVEQVPPCLLLQARQLISRTRV